MNNFTKFITFSAFLICASADNAVFGAATAVLASEVKPRLKRLFPGLCPKPSAPTVHGEILTKEDFEKIQQIDLYYVCNNQEIDTIFELLFQSASELRDPNSAEPLLFKKLSPKQSIDLTRLQISLRDAFLKTIKNPTFIKIIRNITFKSNLINFINYCSSMLSTNDCKGLLEQLLLISVPIQVFFDLYSIWNLIDTAERWAVDSKLKKYYKETLLSLLNEHQEYLNLLVRQSQFFPEKISIFETLMHRICYSKQGWWLLDLFAKIIDESKVLAHIDINATNFSGETPLFFAINYNLDTQIPIGTLLAWPNSDPTLPNPDGITPLMLADLRKDDFLIYALNLVTTATQTDPDQDKIDQICHSWLRDPTHFAPVPRYPELEIVEQKPTEDFGSCEKATLGLKSYSK
jgi:hypothetical protein